MFATTLTQKQTCRISIITTSLRRKWNKYWQSQVKIVGDTREPEWLLDRLKPGDTFELYMCLTPSQVVCSWLPLTSFVERHWRRIADVDEGGKDDKQILSAWVG